MFIIGIILTVIGAGSAIYGLTQLTGFSGAIYNFANELGVGATNPGLIWLIVGAIALIVGIVLMVAGRKKPAQG
jgi:hypothetical protein